MNSPSITGSELEQYRKSRNLSQAGTAEMLGVSAPTVNRWEKGEQEIPGPAQLLLRMLIHGEMPFGEREAAADAKEAEHFWQLKLSLADWHKLEALALAGGFMTVRDYLLALIQEDLRRERDMGTSRTSGEAPVDELALVAETTPGGGGGVDAALAAGAEVFAAQHPLPAGEAGGSAGTDSGRRPKKLRHNQTPEHAKA